MFVKSNLLNAEWVLKLDLPDTGVGEYVDFYQAVGCLIWSHCPNAVLHSENGCMVIDTGGVKSSHDGVGKAVREVKTLVGFMQLIGGDLSHVCAWLNEPLLVGDLNEVLGPAGFRAVPPTPGDVGLPPDVVLGLAACFANRPDLLLAMLDVALPRCHEPPKELEDRWSALAKEAPPVPILARMAEPNLHPPKSPRGALASTSSLSDDARSRLSPEPAKQDCLSEDGEAACSTLTPPVPILARMAEPDLHPPTPPRGALVATSSHSDDARSRLSPEPARQDCLSEDGEAACSTLTPPERSPDVIGRKALLIDRVFHPRKIWA